MEGLVRRMPALIPAALALGTVAAVAILAAASVPGVTGRGSPIRPAPAALDTLQPQFLTAHRCMPCHNGLTTPAGTDASIGFAWRASIMANSSRDPYWQASVRREVLDHPVVRPLIEDECTACHMPMSRYLSRAHGTLGAAFAHLPERGGTTPLDSLAADGVSCTLCHQIQPRGLGDPSSFNGGFAIDATSPDRPAVFGPYDVDAGHAMIMHSSSGFRPTRGEHIRSSELCATCHTLYTTAFDSAGRAIGRLPEQMPYLEWRHSAYAHTQSCQDCHMPLAASPGDGVPITAVLGVPRRGVRRHGFLGGNFFVLGMLNRYRAALAVAALPQELDATAAETRAFLRGAARVALEARPATGDELLVDVTVTNLTGHKLPTGFPSRRAWLRLAVRDRTGAVVFESGAITPAGRIVGNDNDDDPTAYEPHYREITHPDQVEIYESIIGDRHGAVTTGLLSGVGYLKDNRLLPRGFDKRTASADVAVVGGAATDSAFVGGMHRVRYRIAVPPARGPVHVIAELWYQPIGFRWAQNLRSQPAPETNRFVAYYEAMAASSAIVLAGDTITVSVPGG
jgi:hypothetical protein